MVKVAAHGLTMEVHRGWEARMWRPVVEPPATAGPVVRLANFALPATRDTYAAEVAETLQRGEVLVSLVEFDPASANAGLYAPQGAPFLRIEDLDPMALQISGPGRLGLQRFFSLRNRAFSLYVMAREGPGLPLAFDAVNASLRSFRVGSA
jgi:hypothetical protein